MDAKTSGYKFNEDWDIMQYQSISPQITNYKRKK